MRVVTWGFGAMGRGIAKNVVESKCMKLVGVIDKNPEFIGKDVGELLGLETYGTRVRDSIDVIEETNPDIVIIAD